MQLREKSKVLENRTVEREQFVFAIRKFMEMDHLTKPLLQELIDHIDVYEVEGSGKNRTQRIVIYYKFVGNFDIEDNRYAKKYIANLRRGVAVEYVSSSPEEQEKSRK